MRRSPQRTAPRFFSERPIKRRILMIGGGYFLFMLLIFARTFTLHLSDNVALTRLAQSQYQKKMTLAPKRGNIYDQNGDELAIDVKVDSLYANPKQIKQPKELARKLAPLVGLDKERLEELLSQDKKFVWIKRRLSSTESAKVSNLQEKGLGFLKEYRRFYPNRELASTVLGAVGLDSKALAGLELAYDSTLRSQGMPVTVYQDARGQSYVPHSFLELENQNHLTLTIDKTVQFIAERELAKGVQNAKAKNGVAIVMNSRTGEILAMASYPHFDPNHYEDYEMERWKNRAIEDTFEPGSIFKGVTAAAALESGEIDIHHKFNCEGGVYKVGEHTIHDHGKYGALALPEMVKVSSNIGMFKIAQMLGKEEFGEAVSHFGFGKKTGIDLRAESNGILSPFKRWSKVQQGTIAFGQGISVTPLQIVNAYSAIANGGFLMRPFVVRRITDSKGKVLKEVQPELIRQVMSTANAKKVNEMLKLVVGPGGTGMAAEVPEYGVAGKTGTAQKVNEGRGRHGYAEGKFIASFVGFAPADDPRITVLVSINEPKGNHYGGVVSAPVFKEIVRQTLPYLKVPPRGNSGPIILTEQKQPKEPEAKAKKGEKKPRVEEKIAQNREHETHLEWVEIKPGIYKMPDCSGKTVREILRNFKQTPFELSIEGSGICTEQQPSPGSLVQEGSKLKLFFKPPS